MKIHMRFFHRITNSGSPSTSGLVVVVIIDSDPTYFQTDLQGGITKLSWKTTFDVSLIIRRELHLMHNGAPAHFRQLTRKSRGQWIGRGGQVVWSPRPPD
jgi:hypothetical protein